MMKKYYRVCHIVTLQLRATIGGNMAFIGGENRQGYFKSISSIKMFVDENTVELSKVKTMNSFCQTAVMCWAVIQH